MTVGMGRWGNGVLRLVSPGVFLIWCEGCKKGHSFDVRARNHQGKVIGFDGDVQRPSIGEPVRFDEDGVTCEFFIRGGVMYYLSNCTHELSGKGVSMKDYPAP